MSKLLISVPEELIEAVDKHCKSNGYNRSEFIRMLLREALDEGVKETKTVEITPLEKAYEEAQKQEQLKPPERILMGYCETHFERKEYPLVEMIYEDINGNPNPKKLVCPQCLAKVKSEIKRAGGSLLINGETYE